MEMNAKMYHMATKFETRLCIMASSLFFHLFRDKLHTKDDQKLQIHRVLNIDFPYIALNYNT